MKPGLFEKIDQETSSQIELDNPWQVVLFNDEIHSFDEVILQIQKATGYSLERASDITFRVHHNGKAIVYIGSRTDCERVEVVLGQIKLITKLERT